MDRKSTEMTSGADISFPRNKPPKEVLEEGGVSINEVNVTPVDLFSISRGLSRDEKEKIIAKNFRFEQSELESKLPLLSFYWREAKDFYKNFIAVKAGESGILPREIERTEEFKSVNQLIRLLNKTAQLRKGEGVGYDPIYCALANIMLGVNEYHSKGFEGLINETTYATEKLFGPDKEGRMRMHRINDDPENEWQLIGLFLQDQSWENADFTYRGKSKESTLMKILKNPEIFGDSIIKDGIAFKIEVKDEEAARKILLGLPEIFSSRFKTKELIFENTNLFNEEEARGLVNDFESQGVSSYIGKNYSSNRDFRSAKIRGEIVVPQNGEKGKLELFRKFEFQVALANSENETGLRQNKIYKAAQKLSLVTRLFGSFSERYLDIVCAEAHDATGISFNKIKDYVRGFLIKIESRSKVAKFISGDQYLRWSRAGLLPPNLKVNSVDLERVKKMES